MFGFERDHHLGFEITPFGGPDSQFWYFICWLRGRHYWIMNYDSSGHCFRCGIRC